LGGSDFTPGGNGEIEILQSAVEHQSQDLETILVLQQPASWIRSELFDQMQTDNVLRSPVLFGVALDRIRPGNRGCEKLTPGRRVRLTPHLATLESAHISEPQL
jgi:hypothetical protein